MTALHLSSPTVFSPFVWLAAATVDGPYQLGIGGADASRGILSLLTGIVAIAAVPLLYWGARKILEQIRLRKEKSFIEELGLEARRREEAGEFVSAAVAYEKMKNLQKAAELYERGSDFRKAADMYESLGQTDKVSEMHEMAGDLETAAETRMYYGDFAGAALTYNQLGDKLRAAEALENSGNMLAAVKAYREAKDYLKASSLLKEAGLHKEAAEMYAISLAGSEASYANLDKFYNYAILLETAGDRKKAAEVFTAVSKVNPGYRDVRQKIAALGVPDDPTEEGATEERVGEHLDETPISKSAGGETTLRSFIRAGGLEPRHSFRLWVQVLKVLDQSQKAGHLPEILTPDSIFIDSGNNITFAGNSPKDFAYIAPEVVSGSPPDTVSLVYSMGVILYEMLTGSLDAFEIKRPSEVAEVPPWLEELTLKCCERKRESRYRGLDDILAAIVDLKKSQK